MSEKSLSTKMSESEYQNLRKIQNGPKYQNVRKVGPRVLKCLKNTLEVFSLLSKKPQSSHFRTHEATLEVKKIFRDNLNTFSSQY